GHAELRHPRREVRAADPEDLAFRRGRRVTPPPPLGAEEAGPSDGPPEGKRKADRRAGQRVRPGHALYVAPGARHAGAVRAVRDRPAEILGRDAAGVRAADRQLGAPEAEGEGR